MGPSGCPKQLVHGEAALNIAIYKGVVALPLKQKFHSRWQNPRFNNEMLTYVPTPRANTNVAPMH